MIPPIPLSELLMLYGNMAGRVGYPLGAKAPDVGAFATTYLHLAFESRSMANFVVFAILSALYEKTAD